jgi:hypothetical protein
MCIGGAIATAIVATGAAIVTVDATIAPMAGRASACTSVRATVITATTAGITNRVSGELEAGRETTRPAFDFVGAERLFRTDVRVEEWEPHLFKIVTHAIARAGQPTSRSAVQGTWRGSAHHFLLPPFEGEEDAAHGVRRVMWGV